MSLAQNSLNNPLIIIAEIGKVLDINNTQEKNLFSEKIKNKESFMYNSDGELITDIDNIFWIIMEIILIRKKNILFLIKNM